MPYVKLESFRIYTIEDRYISVKKLNLRHSVNKKKSVWGGRLQMSGENGQGGYIIGTAFFVGALD